MALKQAILDFDLLVSTGGSERDLERLLSGLHPDLRAFIAQGGLARLLDSSTSQGRSGLCSHLRCESVEE